MYSLGVRALTFIPFALILVACGPSQEEVVKNALAKRKSPGHVRVVNLSGQPIKVHVKNPDSFATVGPREGSKFSIIAAGNGAVEISNDAGQTSDVTLSVGQNEASTILVTDDNPKGEVVAGEVFRPASNCSIRVIGQSGIGSYTGEIKPPSGQSISEKLGSSTPHSGGAGSYTVSIKDESGKNVATAKVDVKADKAYTVAVAKAKDGKIVTATLLNNPDQRPVMAGTAPG